MNIALPVTSPIAQIPSAARIRSSTWMKRPVAVETGRFESEPAQVDRPAGGDQQAFTGEFRAPGQRNDDRPIARPDPLGRCPSVHVDAFGGERGLHRLRCLRLLRGQETIAGLHDRDVDPEPGQELSQLTADGTAAEHKTSDLGRPFGLDHVVRGPEVDLGQSRDRRDGRLRSGCDHDTHAAP